MVEFTINKTIVHLGFIKITKGDSIDNAIVFDSLDTISGVTEEHRYIDQLCSTFDTGVKSIDQNLIIEDKIYYKLFLYWFFK